MYRRHSVTDTGKTWLLVAILVANCRCPRGSKRYVPLIFVQRYNHTIILYLGFYFNMYDFICRSPRSYLYVKSLNVYEIAIVYTHSITRHRSNTLDNQCGATITDSSASGASLPLENVQRKGKQLETV